MATNYNKDHHNATPHYNGNISALTTDYLTTGITPLVKFFRYDKLNRIKWMKTASTIGNSQSNPGNNFATNYTYDFNGNLAALSRNNHASTVLHDINYQYSTGKNRLNSITSIGLASSSYQYDAIGNLIRDTGEGLEISWNAAGKVDTIWKNGNVLSTFRYSATGQRQMKKTRNITDYYIHDASGNVMCIYRVSKRDFKAVERPIYGAKRLGELKQQVDLTTPTNPSIPPFTIGMRQYELTDHLGNVMATILDRRQPMTLANSDAYLPWIVSTTDYYPFGYPIPNRSTDTGGYRYFFNGQEGDNEVFGEVANFGYEFRQYDSRLGRWWSVDRMCDSYVSHSPYCYSLDSPLSISDDNGKWVRDQNGNIIICYSRRLNRKNFKSYSLSNYLPDGRLDSYSVEGNWGYIMANNGKKVAVFIPNQHTVQHTIYNTDGSIYKAESLSENFDPSKNCTTNSLLPDIPNIIIGSEQISEDILLSEGYVKGDFIDECI